MSSINILLLLAGILLFLWFRYRKLFRKHQPILMEKQIQIHGVQISTPLSKSTPLQCLLQDGMKFGEDFKEKEPPSLPHEPGCQCTLTKYSAASRDWFEEVDKNSNLINSDLGELQPREGRYYKYKLIVTHADVSEQDCQTYKELLGKVPVSSDWSEKVAQHLANRLSPADHNRSNEEPQ